MERNKITRFMFVDSKSGEPITDFSHLDPNRPFRVVCLHPEVED